MNFWEVIELKSEKRMIDPNGAFILKDTNGYTLDFSAGYIAVYDGDGNLRCQFDIDDIPTEDIVEVVRCKDCGWYEKLIWQEGFDCRKLGCMSQPMPDDFCSYGRRIYEK